MKLPDASDWTVLVVDDDEDNLGVPRQVLEFMGAEVYTTENGQEGLDQLATIRPTFLLLDLSMPVMDGWEMLRRIRADKSLETLVVIALTAHAMPGDREEIMEAGFDGYVSKPYFFTTFTDEIERCLESVPTLKQHLDHRLRDADKEPGDTVHEPLGDVQRAVP